MSINCKHRVLGKFVGWACQTTALTMRVGLVNVAFINYMHPMQKSPAQSRKRCNGDAFVDRCNTVIRLAPRKPCSQVSPIRRAVFEVLLASQCDSCPEYEPVPRLLSRKEVRLFGTVIHSTLCCDSEVLWLMRNNDGLGGSNSTPNRYTRCRGREPGAHILPVSLSELSYEA
jgi:hypothetical protein